jgi:hypothetical protein
VFLPRPTAAAGPEEETRMTTVAARGRRRAPPGLALAAAAAATLLLAGCGGRLPPALQDAPDPFAFAPVRNQIPGALVRSERALLTGMLNRTPTVAHAEGAAEELIVNGEPRGARARVKAPAKIAVAVRAPSGYGETAVGRVRVNGTAAEFRVTTMRRPPPDRLAFAPVRAAPGRLAQSAVVAPTGFPPGSALEVGGLAGVQAETREGRVPLPVVLAPGEPFRLVARVPQGQAGPLDLEVRVGTLRGTWRIEPPGPDPEA